MTPQQIFALLQLFAALQMQIQYLTEENDTLRKRIIELEKEAV